MKRKSKLLKKRGIAIALGVIAIPVLIAYYRFDPAGEMAGRWFPKCPVKMLTGWQCPSCGVQRAVHALLHGHPLESLQSNWFLAFSLLYLAGLAASDALRERWPQGRRFFWGVWGGGIYVGVYLGWFLLRNLLDL
ncbi:MAG: DUF2752 domain-containing protein [Muribaculaceae bacterium]|nr:DUF2752 domain-containing protein [Muribaculaceae bacterium]